MTTLNIKIYIFFSFRAFYYFNAFILLNPSRAWQTINDLMSRHRNNKMGKELNLNGISVSNFKELSNTVNKQFSTIGSRPASEINATINYNESSYIINFTVILTTSVSVKLVVMLL